MDRAKFVGAFRCWSGCFSFSFPIALTIIILIGILIISYRQVTQGGWAYMAAKDNLGMNWGRLTWVSLFIDYTLTVVVSFTAGVQAITSAFKQRFPISY
jgi:hypothetical protein